MSEQYLKTYNFIKMKILRTVTLKVYENLVYCNLTAALPIFCLLSVQQITAWSDENYRRSELEMKSCLNNI